MNVFIRSLKIFQNDMGTQCHAILRGRAFAYKSAISLENLYPKSNIKLFTPVFVPEDPSAKFNGYIPMDKLQVTYSRSSGPGGQNVNTLNTKVDVRFHVKDATWLAEEIKEKLCDQYKTRINKDGYFVIKSDTTRSQQLNLADALEKLRVIIRNTLKTPAEPSIETQEKHRKAHLKQARLRLFEKRKRSEIKQSRRSDDNIVL